MNFDTAYKEIMAFFDTGWADLTSVSYPDVEFNIPSDETWVRYNCEEDDGAQVSMGDVGNNRFRHFGIVTIQVFQPQGQGSNDARAKATAALAIFMGKQTTNNAQFLNVRSRTIRNDGNGYYQINIIAPFYYDELT